MPNFHFCLSFWTIAVADVAAREPHTSWLALQVGARLVVLNLSQQTDSADLLGGFRPVEPREALLPLLDRFQASSCRHCLLVPGTSLQQLGQATLGV